MAYIFSTLSSGVNFGNVAIKGGAGVADRRTLVTPQGVVTKVTDSQLEQLQQNETFQRFVKNGVLTVSKHSGDADKVASSMEQNNASKQKTESTLKTKAKVK